jgi:hypothetical protein
MLVLVGRWDDDGERDREWEMEIQFASEERISSENGK